LLEEREEWPFVVVSPQLPRGYWTSYLESVDQLITHLTELLPADGERIYVTGFSLGGNGAWQYALRFPGRFAAAAPVAGVPSATSSKPPDNLCDLKAMPIWVFHSEADTLVSADQDVAAVNALEACGGDVRFTRSTDLDHVETALDAYNNPELYAWFLEHSK
jgi:predicted peptidase